MNIRNKRPEDIERISTLTASAFERKQHASHTEHFIVDALRQAGQLTVSLVAVENDEVVGQVAISPVTSAVLQCRSHQAHADALALAIRRDEQHRHVTPFFEFDQPGYHPIYGRQTLALLPPWRRFLLPAPTARAQPSA